MNRTNYNSYHHSTHEKNPADDYQTPGWLFEYLREKFAITTDIAGDSVNSLVKGSPLYDKGFNALQEDWDQFQGTKFCFPPFSRPYFSQFLHKAHTEWQNGESTIFIAPLKTISVDYFQPVKAPVIHVIYPRLNFVFNGREVNAPDSICILHYDSKIERFVTPELKFLDLKQMIPSSQRR